jgi:ketosteroid isomerase-like protein
LAGTPEDELQRGVHGPFIKVMADAQENLEIARQAVERWNANDLEGVLEFYAQDAVMFSGPDWPEQDSWDGLEALRRNFEEWRDVWESSVMEVEGLETVGDRVLGTGAWNTRGRASGVDGSMPFVILLGFRGGKIATHEWFTERDHALASARTP